MPILKTIKCKCCGERGTPKNNSTLGYYCEKTACQDARIENALKKVRQSTEAETKKANVEWNAERKKIMEKLKTLSDYKADLQADINLIVRLIDKDVPCIATGATTGKRNAGHRFSVGSNDTIRFHLCNIHVQSEHSNKWKGGDNDRYTQGLLDMYGTGYTDYVLSLNQTPKIDLSKEDIKQIMPIARQIIKELKAADRTYNTGERIELRKRYNKQLGIYK